MMTGILSILAALVAGLVGGLISVWLQREKIRHERKLLEDTHKTEFVAEATARYFLQHKDFTDRSFEHLRERLGGFTDDELRKLLVRAGATRIIRSDKSEWWRLLDREEEWQAKRKKSSNGPRGDEGV
jgi:Zn-dependent peptidase ImmA (M78 family)